MTHQMAALLATVHISSGRPVYPLRFFEVKNTEPPDNVLTVLPAQA